VWGESYQRGSFLSRLNRSLYECDVDPDGELPDHLVPVLRYLAVAGQPLAELCAALPQALERMSRALRKVEPRNPYLQLFAAVSHACQALPQAQ
jgi:nitrate reductase delta subunit